MNTTRTNRINPDSNGLLGQCHWTKAVKCRIIIYMELNVLMDNMRQQARSTRIAIKYCTYSSTAHDKKHTLHRELPSSLSIIFYKYYCDAMITINGHELWYNDIGEHLPAGRWRKLFTRPPGHVRNCLTDSVCLLTTVAI